MWKNVKEHKFYATARHENCTTLLSYLLQWKVQRRHTTFLKTFNRKAFLKQALYYVPNCEEMCLNYWINKIRY
jgi:hypothetical protein